MDDQRCHDCERDIVGSFGSCGKSKLEHNSQPANAFPGEGRGTGEQSHGTTQFKPMVDSDQSMCSRPVVHKL